MLDRPPKPARVPPLSYGADYQCHDCGTSRLFRHFAKLGRRFPYEKRICMMLSITTLDGPMQTDIDPDLLRSFIAVADRGGFTRAARSLNRTQSAVSMQIKRLEENVRAALCIDPSFRD
jgi:hypothetical protein